jgi:GcrA cell cycle regulator
MRADFWTKKRIVTLKRLWAQGKPASAIAKELGGVSRGAVLGKIFRLRLGNPKRPAKKASPSATADRAPKIEARSTAVKDRPARRRGAQVTVGAPRTPKRKSVFDLTNRCCRWPHGEPGTKNFFFCGAPGADVENGLPYCPQHMRRAYIVPPDRSGMPRLATVLTPWQVISKLRRNAAA